MAIQRVLFGGREEFVLNSSVQKVEIGLSFQIPGPEKPEHVPKTNKRDQRFGWCWNDGRSSSWQRRLGRSGIAVFVAVGMLVALGIGGRLRSWSGFCLKSTARSQYRYQHNNSQ